MTPLAAYVLIFLMWGYLGGSWAAFFTVVAIGWAISLWPVRRQVRELIRVARARDDPVPEWMRRRHGL